MRQKRTKAHITSWGYQSGREFPVEIDITVDEGPATLVGKTISAAIVLAQAKSILLFTAVHGDQPVPCSYGPEPRESIAWRAFESRYEQVLEDALDAALDTAREAGLKASQQAVAAFDQRTKVS